MPDPQMRTQVTLTLGQSRHYWPHALLALLGVAALVRDLTRLGAMDRPFSTGDLIEVTIILTLLWAFAWKYSVSRFRTPVALIMVIVSILESATGHYRATDALTLIEDCVIIGAALVLAWPLQRNRRNIQTFSSMEEFTAAMNQRKSQD
jgi:uncharacterized membrane protein